MRKKITIIITILLFLITVILMICGELGKNYFLRNTGFILLIIVNILNITRSFRNWNEENK